MCNVHRRDEVVTLLEPTAMFPTLWPLISDALDALQKMIREICAYLPPPPEPTVIKQFQPKEVA
jgi:hypothetical protein